MQERAEEKPSKKKQAAEKEEAEAAAAAAAAAGTGNGADDDSARDEEASAKKRSKGSAAAPIERVDAAVDGIMSGSPFSDLQLSERTQKVKKVFVSARDRGEKRTRAARGKNSKP